MSGDVDVNRLRNWARGYQRLMVGGLAVEAHTACVDDFASDEGEYPYITAADVLALLDRIEAAEAKVARVDELVSAMGCSLAMHGGIWTTDDFAAAWEDYARDLRAALTEETP